MAFVVNPRFLQDPYLLTLFLPVVDAFSRSPVRVLRPNAMNVEALHKVTESLKFSVESVDNIGKFWLAKFEQSFNMSILQFCGSN